MQGSLEDNLAAIIVFRDGEVVLQDKLGISFYRINEVDERLQVAGIVDVDARFSEVRFLLGTFDGLR